MVAEEAASGSPGQTSTGAGSMAATGARTKRQREDVMTPIVDLSEDGGFVLPACISDQEFFVKNPPQVPASEKDQVLGTSSVARQQQLNQDIAVVIRLAETT
ncbi:hypothetical protein L195_g060337, partial [Trifolium pratense]